MGLGVPFILRVGHDCLAGEDLPQYLASLFGVHGLFPVLAYLSQVNSVT